MHLFMKSCVSPSSACLISAPPSPLHFLTSTLSLFYPKLFHLHLWPHPAVSGICCINFRKTSEAETWSRPPGDLVTAQASSVFRWWYLTNNNPSHSTHGPCANSCSSLISFPASNTQKGNQDSGSDEGWCWRLLAITSGYWSKLMMVNLVPEDRLTTRLYWEFVLIRETLPFCWALSQGPEFGQCLPSL